MTLAGWANESPGWCCSQTTVKKTLNEPGSFNAMDVVLVLFENRSFDNMLGRLWGSGDSRGLGVAEGI